MTLAERIQNLRKEKGLSQEELANEMGVSRQAVSKWEAAQSIPDLDKIIALSNFFQVTTDYLLKGTEPKSMEAGAKSESSASAEETRILVSKVFYIVSSFLIAAGLLCACANWYDNQNMSDILGGMMIQAVGIAFYFVGASVSSAKAPFAVKWLNVVLLLFMPVSIVISLAWVSRRIAPYPTNIVTQCLFTVAYAAVIVLTYLLLKMREKRRSK